MTDRRDINAYTGPVRLVDLQRIDSANGVLVVAEAGRSLAFNPRRMFTVTGVQPGTRRGGHAHRTTTQVLNCPSGTIEVAIDDGQETASFILENPDQALIIPPGVWATQTYRVTGTVLVVLCDESYDEAEYIRDYDAFKAFSCR